MAALIGKNIRVEREKQGISQEDLAHKAGVYRTYIGHLEVGRYNASVYSLYKIANALGINVEDIVKI